MGIDNRQYHQTQQPANRLAQPSRLSGCPVVKWLLIINIAVWLLEMMTNNAPSPQPGFQRPHDSLIWNWGYFSVDTAVYGGQIWRFLTFQFLHADGTHLLFNMVALFFFGHFAERYWGSKKFAFYYFACGIAGTLLYTLLLVLPGIIPSSESWMPMVGASAGIYGILVAVAIIAPNLKVLLYFFIPMSIRTLAVIALCIAAYMAFSNGRNAGGEAAHLGGAMLGFILMRNPRLLTFVDGKHLHSANRHPTIDAKVTRDHKIRPRIQTNMDDSEIDRILDKVNREGMQSLTEAEKEVLRRNAG